MDYTFAGYVLPNVSSVVAPLAGRVATADTPSRPGGFPGRRYSGTRGITVVGTLVSDNYDDLQNAWSNLCAAHDMQNPQQLIFRSGWYILASPETLTDSDRQISSLQYDATYRCYDPYFYSTTVSSPALSTTGGTVFCAGNAPARPAITVSVSATTVGSTITIYNVTTNETIVIAPDATGIWTIDCLAEQVTYSGLDRTDVMQGQYLSLAANSNNTLTITCAGGAAISAATISFRARSV